MPRLTSTRWTRSLRALSCALAVATLTTASAASGQSAGTRIESGAAAPRATTVATRPAAPFASLSASALTLRDSIVARARAQVGRRYVTGGESPDRGFDCSGLVKYVVAALGTDVPRTAARQARFGTAVPRDTSRLRPGDLLTFGTRRGGVSHVGIYVGNGRFVHASSKAGRVIESRIDRPLVRYVKPWSGARRIFAPGASDSAAVTLEKVAVVGTRQ